MGKEEIFFSDKAVRSKAQVIKIDRGYPLVRLSDKTLVRCEHATVLIKEQGQRAVVGDVVEVFLPCGHDKGVIEAILPRKRAFVRKDPTERACSQVLAANFDRVLVAQPLADVNVRRLERELVLAYETGADVSVILTKADLANDDQQVYDLRKKVSDLVGAEVETLVVSEHDPKSIESLRRLIPAGVLAVLLGKSGVGKSSLVNLLVGHNLQKTMAIRDDGKGRHTTVCREMIDIPGGGAVVDMPGVRGLGLWEASEGIEAAFTDIQTWAQHCRFRDCHHEEEPGCAVRAAVVRGELSADRFASYQALKKETATIEKRREEARRLRGDKKGDHPQSRFRQNRRKNPFFEQRTKL